MSIDELATLLAASGLREDEQEEFLERLHAIDGNDLDIIITLFRENSDWIEWLYDNYKQKEEAFRSGDTHALEKILERELEKIEE